MSSKILINHLKIEFSISIISGTTLLGQNLISFSSETSALLESLPRCPSQVAFCGRKGRIDGRGRGARISCGAAPPPFAYLNCRPSLRGKHIVCRLLLGWLAKDSNFWNYSLWSLPKLWSGPTNLILLQRFFRDKSKAHSVIYLGTFVSRHWYSTYQG